MNKIWNEVKDSIKSGIPDHTFRMWIEPLQLASCDENRIVIYSPKLQKQFMYSNMTFPINTNNSVVYDNYNIKAKIY